MCYTDVLCLQSGKLTQNTLILLRLELYYYHTGKFMKRGV